MQALKKLLITLLIVLFLLAAYLSVRWAIADILETQIRYQLGKAQTDGQTLDARQWRLTYDMLQTVLKLHPDYSSHLELAVIFYQEAANLPQALLDELGWHDSQEKSLEYARCALLKRPTWPYLWDELFQSKIILNQFDNESTSAMEHAVKLGPWELDVQYDIASTGLDFWHDLPAAAQQTIINAMEQTLTIQQNSELLHKDMQENDNIGKLCQQVNSEPAHRLNMLKQYCQQYNSGGL
jgi:hypothetical protein